MTQTPTHAAQMTAAMPAVFPAMDGSRFPGGSCHGRFFRARLKCIDLAKSRQKSQQNQEDDDQQFLSDDGGSSIHTPVIARTRRIFQKIINIF